MNEFELNELSRNKIISDEQRRIIEDFEAKKSFSLRQEIKSMLYLGVLLLNIGLGRIIYENIHTIGHHVIITGIAVLTIFCFWYSFKNRKPFSLQEIKNDSPFTDYILLLGCLTFLVLEGYLQYQYNIFGQRYGLATIIPTIIFFPAAYYFDHRGVLSLGITTFASWLGVTVSPIYLLQNGLGQNNLIYAGLVFGILLCAAAYFTENQNFKKHFNFTYLNFAANILFISSLTGLIVIKNYFVFFLLLIVLVILFIKYAIDKQSFYFLTISMIYGYWALSYLVLQMEFFQSMFILYYFIITSIVLIVFLIKFKKRLDVKKVTVNQI